MKKATVIFMTSSHQNQKLSEIGFSFLSDAGRSLIYSICVVFMVADSIGCSNKSQIKHVTMIQNNTALIEATIALAGTHEFKPLEVERVLGVTLTIDSERSNDFYSFYVGRPADVNTSLIQDVEFRVPKSNMKSSGGFASIVLKKSCNLTGAEVIANFGDPATVMVPTPEASSLYSADYGYRKSGAQVHFAIGRAPSDGVVLITIDRTGEG